MYGVYNNSFLSHNNHRHPTLQRVAGGNGTIEGIDGLNLWDSISTNGTSPRQEFVYDINDVKNRSAIRYKNYKLTWRNPGYPGGWYNPPPGVQEPPLSNYTKLYRLYDLEVDPTETTDISPREDMKKVFLYMKNKLDHLRLNISPSLQATNVAAGKPQYWGGAWTPGWC
ncbi:uncharacterized protein LOC112568592 [Pomacea canaliculata]|uniref:uncharacterized protein LOC112568592 n=1 Tax=Pomacea canaliculata TaxID=400727 RepID=UPI000D72AA2B|nr:uncharacterized protein LOC112568592 [Pomacea canaliculata]